MSTVPQTKKPAAVQSAEEFASQPAFAEVDRTVRRAPPRYRNEIGKYSVFRSSACAGCGKCIEACPEGVHTSPDGYRLIVRPNDYLCVGPACSETDRSCVAVCPEQALTVTENPAFETIGDHRWTADILAAAWSMAETGSPPPAHLSTDTGTTGGGFDKLRIRYPDSPPADLRREDHLYRTAPQPQQRLAAKGQDRHPLVRRRYVVRLHQYPRPAEQGPRGQGVQYVQLHRRRRLSRSDDPLQGSHDYAGGHRPLRRPRGDDPASPIVEFKYAQGAKPGLGGHLLGDKNTPEVAAMREAMVGTSLFSPFPFHSVYSIEDHKKHLDWISHINPNTLLSAKVSTPGDVDMVAVGVYCAGAHIVHIDGSYGGTGAAPNIAKKNIAMPIEYAINRVHQFLVDEGVRDEITLIASGGIRNPADLVKAIAMGADGVVIGTAELAALGCIRCGCCESGRGCARGICTTDSELLEMLTIEWSTQRLVNLYSAWRETLIDMLYRLGLDSVAALRGRTDLLMHLDYENDHATA